MADSRARRTKRQWAEIVRRYEAGGSGQREFCSRHGLSLSSLQRWRQRLADAPATSFVELVPEREPAANATRWTLEVSLPGGTLLRFQS